MFTSRDDDERRVDADRLGKRRQPDPGREGTRLMMHVDDLRLPLPPRVLEHARLDHVEHVGVAVVVVADVLLIQARQPRQLVRRADVLHVPLGDHLLAVRIDRRPQHEDDVVENRFDVGSLARLTRSCRSSGVCCGPATSVECRPPSMWTKRAAVSARVVALVVAQPCGCASRRAISR
jgi:hypothetical protein